MKRRDIYEIIDEWLDSTVPCWTISLAINEGRITKEDFLGYVNLFLSNCLEEMHSDH